MNRAPEATFGRRGGRRLLTFTGLALVLACRDETPLTPPAPNVVGAVASIVVTAPRQVLAPGDSVQLTAQAFDALGRVLPTVTIAWSSSNSAVASIDSRGAVVAIAVGSATITATASGQSGSTELVVSIAQLCDCTRIVDSTATALVQRSDSTGVYVFRVVGGQTPAIDSGSIIVGAEDGGFLRRVAHVTRSGDLITVETTQAYLDEAVESGDFLATMLTDESASGDGGATRWGPWTTTYAAPGVSEGANGLCCKLDRISIGLKSDSGARLPGKGPVQTNISGEFTIKKGDIDFLPRLELGSQIRLGRLQSFRAAHRGGLELNLDAYELKLTAAVTTDKLAKTFVKDSILYIKQRPFATFIGPMPVAGIISYQLNLKVTPTVSGSVVFGGMFRTGFGITSGVQWARDAGWSPVFSASSYFEATPPQFQGAEGTASLKIALVPEVSVQFYGVAGPKLELEPYADAAAAVGLSFAGGAPTGLDWETKVSLGLNLNIGAKISVLGRVDLAEATFGVQIIKPHKLIRDFSDGPLTVFTSVTGEDRPGLLNVRLRPAFVDTLPPLGRDLSMSTRDVPITANDSLTLHEVRSGTAYRHTVAPIDLPGNCTFGPPLESGTGIAQFVEHKDTVTINSRAFITLGAAPAVDTLRVDCIPLGNLLVRTVTTGRDATSRSLLTLERLDKVGTGKGTPPLLLDIPGGDTPPDTVIAGLVPLNPDNGATGQYIATLDPGRRNCAVAKPSSQQAIITSGDTSLAEFRIRCVPLGSARAGTKTADPDAASPSDPVVYSLSVVDRDAAASASTQGATGGSALGASATALVTNLVPLYNASGATGRHAVNLTGAPNRCVEAAQFTRPVTVFPGDTALADFAVQCVERLHVATTSTGPGTDGDGYIVIVENDDGTADSVAIATSDTVGIAGVPPGVRTIRLADVDAHCIAPASVQRNLSGRDSTLVSFVVNCPGPSAPRGLRTTLVESTRIDLAWSPAPSAPPVAFYRLYRSTVGVPGSALVVDAIPAPVHSDLGLPAFTRFTYQVAAVDASGIVGPLSAPLTVRTRDGSPPSAPFGLNATPVSGLVITLAWGAATDPETGISRYRVYRDGVLLDSTTATSYMSAGLTPLTAYTYEVLAVNGEGLAGPLSAPASATTLDATPPSTPTGLTATAAGMAQIDLTWNAAADPETGVARYHIYRAGVLVGSATTTTFSDVGLTPATTYTYEVSAENGSGVKGGRSAPATATTSPPPVATGDLSVTVQTQGANIPAAGYLVQLSSGGVPVDRPVSPNETLLFSGLVAQTYGVLLHGLPANCAVVDGVNPRIVTVGVGSVVRTTFIVACQ